MQWKHINGLKLKLKLIFILFKVCFVLLWFKQKNWRIFVLNACLASGTAEFFKIRRYQRVPSKKTLQMVECKANEGHPESTIRNHLRWKSTAQVDGGFQGTLEAERTNCKNCSIHRCGDWWGNRIALIFWEWWFLSWYGPNHLGNGSKKYRPALPPWLIPLNKIESSNQPKLSIQKSTSIGRNSDTRRSAQNPAND